MKPGWRYHLALFAVCWIWGLAFVGVKVLLEEVSYITLNLLRFLLAGCALLPLLLARWGKRPRLSAGEWTLVCVAGICAIYGYHLALTYGETTIPAGTAGLIANTTPVFAALLAGFLLGESLGRLKALGILSAMGGVAIITILGSDASLGAGRVQGALLVLLAAAAWAVYTVLLKPLVEEHDPLFVTAYAVILGTLALLPLALACGDCARQVRDISGEGWAWLAFLGLGCTVAGYLLYSWGLEGLGATQAAFYTYLIAPISLFWGWAWLGERVNAGLFLGTALILVGLAAVGLEERRTGNRGRERRG
ncbi:DMT family transporter [Candidatus Solincola sp.]|nr:DMT family transporter [Actinomycetota bacterium]